MRHLIFWIITVPLVIVLVTFTVMNTQEITLDLWPLPWEAPVPVYGLIFGGLLIGFFFGLLVMWRHGAPSRRRHRDLARQHNIQASELDTLRRNTVPKPSRAVARSDANALVPPAI